MTNKDKFILILLLVVAVSNPWPIASASLVLVSYLAGTAVNE